jgi:hypothetical protein
VSVAHKAIIGIAMPLIIAVILCLLFLDGKGYNPYYDTMGRLGVTSEGSDSFSATSDIGRVYGCNGGFDRCGFLEDRSNNGQCARQKIFNGGRVVKVMKDCYFNDGGGPQYASWSFNAAAHQTCSVRYANGAFDGCGIKSGHAS